MRSHKAAQLLLLGEASAEHTRRAWKGAVKTSRARKGPSPAPRPWQCVVLGVDTARRSGWSIFAAGKYVQSGELNTHWPLEIEKVIDAALQLAAIACLPCVLVLERPWGGSVDVVAGLGAAREAWEAQWRRLAEGHRGKVVRVAVATWRGAVLPRGSVGATREECHEAERLSALAIIGMAKHPIRIGSDEAAAVCIGWWGAYAGEVGALLGKRARAAALAAWTGKQP